MSTTPEDRLRARQAFLAAKEKALGMLREGHTPGEVAAALGLKYVTVRDWHGQLFPVPGRARGRPRGDMSPSIQEQIQRLACGDSFAVIAADLGIKPPAVRATAARFKAEIAAVRGAHSDGGEKK